MRNFSSGFSNFLCSVSLYLSASSTGNFVICFSKSVEAFLMSFLFVWMYSLIFVMSVSGLSSSSSII